MLPGMSAARPRWLVCEDGDEYVARFVRFLSGEFEFVACDSAAALVAALAGAAGVILDQDFRRSPTEALVDELGQTAAVRSPEERARLAASQGVLVLRALRARGVALPVLLFLDLDDAPRVAELEAALAPVEIVPSHEGLAQTADRLRRLSSK
jgi:hypothetical protein